MLSSYRLNELYVFLNTSIYKSKMFKNGHNTRRYNLEIKKTIKSENIVHFSLQDNMFWTVVCLSRKVTVSPTNTATVSDQLMWSRSRLHSQNLHPQYQLWWKWNSKCECYLLFASWVAGMYEEDEYNWPLKQ